MRDEKHGVCILFMYIHTSCRDRKLYTYWSMCSCIKETTTSNPNSLISPSSVIFIFFSDFFRWLWRHLRDDLTGLDACAPDVWGWRANALHPRGSQFRPSDGHGDSSLWVAHGQRQPAHLAIDTPSTLPKRVLTSNLRTVTENSGESKVEENNITERTCYCCVMDT